MRNLVLFIALALCSLPAISQKAETHYKHFKVAVYVRAYEVKEMADLEKLEATWNIISSQVGIDKIYLETHRDKIIVDDKTLEKAKKFFTSRGIEVAGGITFTMDESNHFETFCYTNPEHRDKAKAIAKLTAKHFDEFILDDFFFTSCKCDLCIAAKGTQSWTNFRLKLMEEAGRDLIVNPAKAVNPKVKVVIKYPNWYEHFQGLGFNLEAEPAYFDGIYTGTETRDPVHSNQHLQQYESYLVYRYFENIKPGKNGGGWVDPGGLRYMDRYAEQLWNTLFAKAPEITLFDYRQLQRAIDPKLKGEWQNTGTSFSFDQLLTQVKMADGSSLQQNTIARACGLSFDLADQVLGHLGNPVAIKTYRPYHATGEDFLQNYLGMIGLPMDILPSFPENQKMILLTEEAKIDKEIVTKMKNHMAAGNNIIITSGLLQALQGKGIEDIVELKHTNRKALVNDFKVGWNGYFSSVSPILITQIEYLTNDSWEDITSFEGTCGWPILHQAMYSRGSLFVLTIPDNYSDLYQLPEGVLNRIRQVASQEMPVRIEGPAQVSLFCYDNGSFIVESYLPEPVNIKVILPKLNKVVTDVLSGEKLSGTTLKPNRIWGQEQPEVTSFDVEIKPHSFRVFKSE